MTSKEGLNPSNGHGSKQVRNDASQIIKVKWTQHLPRYMGQVREGGGVKMTKD